MVAGRFLDASSLRHSNSLKHPYFRLLLLPALASTIQEPVEECHTRALLQRGTVSDTTMLSNENHPSPRMPHHGFASMLQAEPNTSKAAKESSTASKAQLNEDGYKEVAALEDSEEMETFIKRVAAELGYDIRSEAKLKGVVPYYDGEMDTQSFKALKAELARASNKTDGWAKKAGGEGNGDDNESGSADADEGGNGDDDESGNEDEG